MNRDIIFVNDAEDWCYMWTTIAETKYNLNPTSFTKPSEALEHLMQKEEAPLACFVDMKPYTETEMEQCGYDEKQLPELPIPEKIYEYVKSQGWEESFYFVSRHRSQHDDEVLSRTGAKFVSSDKPQMTSVLEEIAKQGKD